MRRARPYGWTGGGGWRMADEQIARNRLRTADSAVSKSVGDRRSISSAAGCRCPLSAVRCLLPAISYRVNHARVVVSHENGFLVPAEHIGGASEHFRPGEEAGHVVLDVAFRHARHAVAVIQTALRRAVQRDE